MVYRAGFAKSRDMARQLVTHGHFKVNGGKVDIPSYRVTETDIIEAAPKSLELTPFIVARAEAGERQVPAWLEVIPDKMRVLVHAMPDSRPDRHPGARAAHRRAVLEVTQELGPAVRTAGLAAAPAAAEDRGVI